MQSFLAHNVPRFVAHISERGGVTNDELAWLQCEKEKPDYPQEIFARADEYLFYPKDEKTFNQGLFVLTLALAIMSFIPGGVHVFGLHFCSEIDNFVCVEDENEA